MPNRTIYFKDDIYSKLKEEKEPSKLIGELLDAHFKANSVPYWQDWSMEKKQMEMERLKLLEQLDALSAKMEATR